MSKTTCFSNVAGKSLFTTLALASFLATSLPVQTAVHGGVLFVDAGDPGCDALGPVYCGIQEAIDDAVEGDEILVRAGTYDPILVETDNLTIQGIGGGEVVIDATGVNAGVDVNADGVAIRRLTVENAGRGFRLRGNANQLQNNEARGNRVNGFEVFSDANTLNANTSVANNNGFVVVGGHFNTLRGNLAEGNNSRGFFLTKQFQFIIPTFPSRFSMHNTLEGNIARGNGRSGFHLQFGSSYNTLRGNRAEDNGTALDPGDEFGFLVIRESDANTLQGNVADGNTGEGFVLANCSFNTLKANSARNNGASGFVLVDLLIPCPIPFLCPYWDDLLSQDGPTESNTFSGNTAKNNDGDGFQVIDEDLANDDANTFENNTSIQNTGWGFFVDALLANTFENNNCQLNDLGGSNQPGICD